MCRRASIRRHRSLRPSTIGSSSSRRSRTLSPVSRLGSTMSASVPDGARKGSGARTNRAHKKFAFLRDSVIPGRVQANHHRGRRRWSRAPTLKAMTTRLDRTRPMPRRLLAYGFKDLNQCSAPACASAASTMHRRGIGAEIPEPGPCWGLRSLGRPVDHGSPERRGQRLIEGRPHHRQVRSVPCRQELRNDLEEQQ